MHNKEDNCKEAYKKLVKYSAELIIRNEELEIKILNLENKEKNNG